MFDDEFEDLILLSKSLDDLNIERRSVVIHDCSTCSRFYNLISSNHEVTNEKEYMTTLEDLIVNQYSSGGECKTCGNTINAEDFDIDTNQFVQNHKAQLTRYLHRVMTRNDLISNRSITASSLFLSDNTFKKDDLDNNNNDVQQQKEDQPVRKQRGRKRLNPLKTKEAIEQNMIENRKNKFESIKKLFAMDHKIPQDIVDLTINDYINIVGDRIFRTNNRLLFIAALMYQECAALNCFKNVDLIFEALNISSAGLSKGNKMLNETIVKNKETDPNVQKIYDRLFSSSVTENIMDVYLDTMIKSLFIPPRSMTDDENYYFASKRAEVYKRIVIRMFNYLTKNYIYPTTTNTIKLGACLLFLIHETRGIQYNHEEYDRQKLSKNTIKKIYKDILLNYRKQFITIMQLEQPNLN